MSNKNARLRRARKTRIRILQTGQPRLCIFRTPRHIYAQIINAENNQVLASASTVDKTIRTEIKNGGNVEAAQLIGKTIAERAKDAGLDKVAFDRSGFRYHGRVKALAEAARENGLMC